MNKYKVPFGAALLFAGVLLVSNAQTVQTFDDVKLTNNPISFGIGTPGWESGDIQLAPRTTIGGTPLELRLNLSQTITLTSLGSRYNYRFGMSGLTPAIAPAGDAFNFAIELLESGTPIPITPTFTYDFAHPCTFGFDDHNPFSYSVDNLSTSGGTGRQIIYRIRKGIVVIEPKSTRMSEVVGKSRSNRDRGPTFEQLDRKVKS